MADLFQLPVVPELMQDVESDIQQRPQIPDNSVINTNTTTNTTVGTVVARIESIMESIMRNLSERRELSIDFPSRQVTRRDSSESRNEQIRFPGRSLQEAKRFARVLLILQLAHDALVSGTVLTKRHIYYQHLDLFERQSQVDNLVDEIAFNLRVNRADLNIVAASKSSLAGPLAIRLKDGTSLDPTTGEAGILIPDRASVSYLDLDNVKWVLVIEKDAIYRSLCSTRFWQTPAFGPGVLVTAKGYPDLICRSFLHLVNSTKPSLPIFGLMDLDPDGINILRCYRHGSDRLSHELNSCTPAMQWLGIKTCHLLDIQIAAEDSRDGNSQTRHSQTAIASTACQDPISYLTARDRTAALRTLNKVAHNESQDTDASEIRRELQTLLLLGCKAEVEWLDDSGNLNQWLHGQLTALLVRPQ